MVTKAQTDDGIKQRPQYSMPGILHFLQTEWARFEMERSQWEVERAELQVSKNLLFSITAQRFYPTITRRSNWGAPVPTVHGAPAPTVHGAPAPTVHRVLVQKK